MGLFSWKTQDTGRSIPCEDASRDQFEVTMTDNKGNRWTEKQYQGYGEFGGKDFFELLAEMNGRSGRDAGIELCQPLLSPNLTENKNWTWINESPANCEFQGFFYEE